MGTEVKISVGGLQGKLQLTGRGHAGHEVRMDYYPPLGDDNGFTGMELLLTSLAGCSGHTVLFLLRKMGKTIENLEIHAVGNRRDEHPTIFTEIELEYRVKGSDLDGPSVEKAISLSEEKYCPVWAMLKNGASIKWRYSIQA